MNRWCIVEGTHGHKKTWKKKSKLRNNKQKAMTDLITVVRLGQQPIRDELYGPTWIRWSWYPVPSFYCLLTSPAASITVICLCVWLLFSHFLLLLLFILHIQDARVLFWHRTATLSAAVCARQCRRHCVLSAASAQQGPGLRGDGAVQWALQLGLKNNTFRKP